jgi:hypothetical protein
MFAVLAALLVFLEWMGSERAQTMIDQHVAVPETVKNAR